MLEEIKDNYGKLPKAVQLLFEKKRLDILINEPYVENFQEQPKELVCHLPKPGQMQLMV